MKNLLKTVITSYSKTTLSVFLLTILLGGLALARYLIQIKRGFEMRKEVERIEMEIKKEEETPQSPQALQLPESRVKHITTIKEKGGRVDWSHSGSNLIAFDRMGADGYYDVYTMKPDGSNEKCLTCDRPDLPNRDIGQPAWHPSGKYIVFQVEKAEQQKVWLRYPTSPGAGLFNDLWVMNLKTGKAALLWELPNGKNYGALHPHFSSDGKMLSWSEMYESANIFKKGKEFGFWKLKIADVFEEGDLLKLTNVREFEPGDSGFYENHGFFPDGSKLIFSSNFRKNKSVFDHTNIYAIELDDESVVQLTHEGYNEHALYSPDGKKIVWMTDKGNPNKGTDYWLMNADGSNKQRLTFFNQLGRPHYLGRKIIAADSSWSPDGTKFAGYYHTGANLTKMITHEVEEKIVLMELEEEAQTG